VTDASDRALAGIARDTKAVATSLHVLSTDLRSVTHALVGIHEALKDSNRARDKWARAVVDVLEEAKEGTESDEDSG
jgi:hypothetical protein